MPQVADITEHKVREETVLALMRQRVTLACFVTLAFFRHADSSRLSRAMALWHGLLLGAAAQDAQGAAIVLRAAHLGRVRNEGLSTEMQLADPETRVALLLQYKHCYLARPFLLWREQA